MSEFFKWLFNRGRRIKICQHPNLFEQKWLDKDDTPMLSYRCPDCGFMGEGHVYADPATWLEEE